MATCVCLYSRLCYKYLERRFIFLGYHYKTFSSTNRVSWRAHWKDKGDRTRAAMSGRQAKHTQFSKPVGDTANISHSRKTVQTTCSCSGFNFEYLRSRPALKAVLFNFCLDFFELTDIPVGNYMPIITFHAR